MEQRDQVHHHKQTKAIINRLSRIEGHIRSVKKMVEEGRDCSDILIQISAVRSAIDKVGKVVLEDHLESCLFDSGALSDDNEVWLDVKEALDVYF
jgi:DNA-binding FrmR family transcriptional regulator